MLLITIYPEAQRTLHFSVYSVSAWFKVHLQ
jgi:hypothetical protein